MSEENTQITQWLQKNYMEVPGTVYVTAKDVFLNFSNRCDSKVSSRVLGQIIRQIFGNIKIRMVEGKSKYVGLRPNFVDDRPATEEDIHSLAGSFGYFPMGKKNCCYTFGIETGYSINRNEILKVISILPDKSYKLSVAGREVNITEIGLKGLSMDSYLDIKIIFNTFKQINICKGKSVSSKTDTNKFSVVQEFSKKGDENTYELRRTARKCHGVLPFTSKVSTCQSCNRQKSPDPPAEENIPTETRDVLFKRMFPDSSDLMLTFLRLQSDMSLDERDSRNRRWNREIIQVCLTLWNRSPQAYTSLRNSGMLLLPSESLLSRYKNCLQQSPGINEEMFRWIDNETQNLKTEKSGGLIIDEMSVQEDLKMSFRNGAVSVDGLVEMGQFVEDMTILNTKTHETRTATHVMQFIFLSYDGFRFPIAYYPTAGANAPELYDMVWQVINKLYEYDFYVHYVCFDGCSNNRAFQMMHFENMSDAKEKEYTVVSPYCPSQRITFMMDYSHNIKKLRNNIHSSGSRSFCTKKLVKENQFILWDFWIEAYTWDKQYNTPIRVHQKLTDEHIFLTKTSKMRNHLAEHVLDKDMLNLMLKYQETLKNGSHLSMAIELLQHTSKVIELFRDRRPVSNMQDKRLEDLLQFENWLQDWSISIRKRTDLSASERNKSFITNETYSDLVSMVHGFLYVCKQRIKKNKKSVTPSGINSDVVENFFCMQRTINHGSNSNPTIHQYKYAINSTVLGQNAVSKKSNACSKRMSCQPFNFTCPKPLNKKPCIRL